jgi:signal transduction histidine kinase
MTMQTGILPSVEEAPSGFDKVYAEETRQLLTERFRAILTVGALAYGAFWILDLFVAPEHSAKFLLIRAIAIAWAMVTLWVSYTHWGRRSMVPLSVALLVVASLGISAMTVLLGGFTSNYYIGNLLVLFGLGLFLPWRLSVTLTFCLLLTLGYLGPNVVVHGPSLDMLAPTFFVLGTSAITCVAVVMSDRHRRRDLALRLQLEKVNEDLKQLDEAKMRFFANVSHELRTPLTLLFGPMETLQSEGLSPRRAQLLEAMQTNARRLLRQVNALLDVAKLEAGRLAFEPIMGDLSELLNELVAASAPHAARKGVLLEARGLEDLAEFPFDYDKVEMIAANLISNAVKFTPKGGRITMSTARYHVSTRGRASVCRWPGSWRGCPRVTSRCGARSDVGPSFTSSCPWSPHRNAPSVVARHVVGRTSFPRRERKCWPHASTRPGRGVRPCWRMSIFRGCRKSPRSSSRPPQMRHESCW